MIVLDADQIKLLKLLREALVIHKSVILCAPCGAGKTTMSSHIMGAYSRAGKSAHFCIHRRQLIDQVMRELIKQEIPHGFIAADYPESDAAIKVCMQQTYIRRDVIPANLIVIDECHIQPDIYKQIIDKNPDAYIIGLSATPELLSGKPLDAFKCKVETVTTADLIKSGRLCKFKYYAPTEMDFSKVKSRGGDYIEKEVSAIVEKSTLIGDSITHYVKYGEGGRFLNFSYSVKHSKETARRFTEAGFPCIHVDAETDDDIRIDALDKLVAGEIRGVSNCGLFIEGTDCPSLEVLIKQRPTKSAMRNRQMDGRVLRAFSGKEYGIIIDMVNNYKVLNQLPDTVVEWNWNGKKKRRTKEKLETLRRCTKCFKVLTSNRCDDCNIVLPPTAREIEQKEGELRLIEKLAEKRRKQISKWEAIKNAKSSEDLMKWAEQNGYNPYYGLRLWNLKRAKQKS